MNRLYLRICIWSFSVRAEAVRNDIRDCIGQAEALKRKAAKLEAARDMLRGQLMVASK